LVRILKSLGRDADDCIAFAVKDQLLTDRARRSAKSPLPQTVAEDDARRVPSLLMGGRKAPPRLRLRAEDLEEIRRRDRRLYSLRLPVIRKIGLQRPNGRKLREDRVLRAPVEEVGGCDLNSIPLRTQFLNRHYAPGVAVRQGAQ